MAQKTAIMWKNVCKRVKNFTLFGMHVENKLQVLRQVENFVVVPCKLKIHFEN